jgi:DNA-binding HxlR family transcriptional regulator
VEYALTEKGAALLPIIDGMRVYGERWIVQGCEDRVTSAIYSPGVAAAVA